MLISLLSMLFTERTSGTEISEPDFAFPVTVINESEELLRTADSQAPEQAAVTRLLATMQLCRARTEIDPDSIYSLPSFIAGQTEKMNGYPAGQAMMTLLNARILNNIYRNDSYRIDQVSAPLTPLPEDVRLWSAQQFTNRIEELVNEALALAHGQEVPLSVFNSCLDIDPIVEQYLGTVYNFICLESVRLSWNVSTVEDNLDRLLELSGAAPQKYLWYYLCCHNFNTLSEIYAQNETDAMAQLILLGMLGSSEDESDSEEISVDYDDLESYETTSRIQDARRTIKLIEVLTQNIRQQPSGPLTSRLQEAVNKLHKPVALGHVLKLYSPQSEITLKGHYLFCPSLKVKLYRLPESFSDNYIGKERLVNLPCVFSGTIETRPDSLAMFTYTIPPVETGIYALTLQANDSTVSRPAVLTVSPAVGISLGGSSYDGVVTMEPITGKPVGGITVLSRKNDRTPAATQGNTDSKGFLALHFDENGGHNILSFSQNGRALPGTLNLGIYSQLKNTNPTESNVLIITDRKLYHPGDTVQWAVIAARENNGNRHPLTETDINLIFYNANHEEIDTVQVRTDRMGRAYGSFAIPREGLTGTFGIRCKGPEHTLAYRSITVSDFRMPVFELTDCSVERDVPSRGDVTVTGHAVSFAGMNIIGADVTVTVNEAYRAWRFRSGRMLGQVDSITDEAGLFRVVIPADLLSTGDGAYMAQITITSAAGETAEETVPFTTGRPYTLKLISDSPMDASAPLPLQVMAYDPNGENVPVRFTWQLLNRNRQECLNGTGASGVVLDINASALEAGKYYFKAIPEDSTLADPLSGAEIVIYNRDRNLVPDLGSPLFIPSENVTVDRRGRGEVIIGVAAEEAWVYNAYSTELSRTNPEVKRLRRGFHSIKITGITEETQLSIFTVKNGYSYSEEVRIQVPAPVRPSIVASSFRDNLLPGSPERWTFRLCNADGSNVIPAAMVARMYNRALDLISPADFPRGFSFLHPRSQLRVSSPVNLNGTNALYVNGVNYIDHTLPMPSLRYLPLFFRIYGARNYTTMLKASAMVSDEAEMMDMDLEEEVGAPEIAATEAGAGTEEGNSENVIPQIKFRPAEILQAFFRPDIVTDEHGNMVIEFTVPEANGSWNFQALAWDSSVECADFKAEIITSKPVMVQPNMPRFLRQGDTARLMATVFNNSSAETSVTARIEVYDFDSEQILFSSENQITIPAGMSGVCSLDIEVPVSTAALGYRVYAITEDFSDGERGAIPVLEAAQTVIDSHEFYINPSDSVPADISVPAEPGMTYTLEFCNNPIWLAVKALRGINSEVPTTSSALNSQLFSLLAGAYLAEQNPVLARTVNAWAESPDNQALISMLQRNEELKQLMLGSTPWIDAARDNNLRMASLCQLFDADANAAAVNKRVEQLSSLQNPDGGIRWAPCWEVSSVWATENFLITMAMAESLEIPLGSDLEPIVEQAFSYLCSRLDNSNSDATDYVFTLISALMPDQDVTGAGRRVISNTVADIERNWRNHSIYYKAFDIMILTATGHQSQARTIFRSIEQFAVTSPDMGMSFPSVEDIRIYATIMQAYKAMDAPASRMDAMRQWVVLRSQVSDDLGAWNPDYVIASLLLSGTDWTAATPEAHITVNGQPLRVSEMETATGYFTAPVSPAGNHIEVTVTPNGQTPSFGALIGTGKVAMSSIEARPGHDISIDKRILVMRDNQWVETDSLLLGERARVQLTLRTARDLQYVTITDLRAATFAPVEQLPRYLFQGGLFYYRENRNASTNVFINELPAGVYIIEYDMTAAVSGTFSAGTATVQSQYAPEITARSGSAIINVNNRQ